MGIPLVFLLFLCPHPHQGFLAGAGALVLRTGSVEAVDKREEELMGGKAVALLYLVVAHVGELVGAVALEAVEHGGTHGERAIFQQILLCDEAETEVIGVVVEIIQVAWRAVHQIDVEAPAMLQCCK